MPDADLTMPDALLARTERERQVGLANAEQHAALALQAEKQAAAEMKRLAGTVEHGGGTYAERRAYRRAASQRARMTQVYELATADVKRLGEM